MSSQLAATTIHSDDYADNRPVLHLANITAFALRIGAEMSFPICALPFRQTGTRKRTALTLSEVTSIDLGAFVTERARVPDNTQHVQTPPP